MVCNLTCFGIIDESHRYGKWAEDALEQLEIEVKYCLPSALTTFEHLIESTYKAVISGQMSEGRGKEIKGRAHQLALDFGRECLCFEFSKAQRKRAFINKEARSEIAKKIERNKLDE
jgi:hypothetical protein